MQASTLFAAATTIKGCEADRQERQMELSASALATLLVRKGDQEEEFRWAQLEDSQLDQEIEIYRKGIQALSAELSGQGMPISLNKEDTDGRADHRPPGVEVLIDQRCKSC